MMRKEHPALKPGELVRLSPGAAPVRVIRVSPGAAYVGRKVQQRSFQAWDVETHSYKTVPGFEKMVVEAISVHSMVERLDEDSFDS